jgi:hypothetical protein
LEELKKTTKVSPHPDVVYTTLTEGEGVLLHMGTSHYFTLNETGTFIWQLLGEGLTLGEVEEKLQERYDVSPERAEQSVLDLVRKLEAEKLLAFDVESG